MVDRKLEGLQSVEDTVVVDRTENLEGVVGSTVVVVAAVVVGTVVMLFVTMMKMTTMKTMAKMLHFEAFASTVLSLHGILLVYPKIALFESLPERFRFLPNPRSTLLYVYAL